MSQRDWRVGQQLSDEELEELYNLRCEVEREEIEKPGLFQCWTDIAFVGALFGVVLWGLSFGAMKAWQWLAR